MRYILLISFAIMILAGKSQSQSSALMDSVDQLIEQKQYKTAFRLLQKADPKNNKPEVLFKKTDLLTRYYVTSINHMMFAVKDLKPGKTVMDYRGKPGDYSLYYFDADSLIRRLIRKKGESVELYRELADYWFEVYLRYGDKPKGRKAPLDSVKKFSGLAINAGDQHFDTYYKLAYCYLEEENFPKAIPLFKESIKRNDTFPSSHYNLSYANLSMNMYSTAVIHANKAFELYDDPAQKADAARLAGIALLSMKRPDKALHFFDQSTKYDPDNHYTLQGKVQAYFMLEKLNKADSLTQKLFNRFPKNPRIANLISSLYADNDQVERFISIMKDHIKTYENEPEVKANIYFALANVTLKTNADKAREYILKAKMSYEKIYPENHQIFETIQRALEYIEKQKKQ
ncbi:MAG: hypothetical protein K9H84_01510 [Bacteroidales bacterium]|nr:hypothetical protein [Bacteroidales bacterium]